MSRTRIGVLVSGSGSNLQALIDACAHPHYPADIALVLSNRPGVRALDRAAAAGLPATVIDHKHFDSRETFEQAMDAALSAAGVELVVCAGFMRVLTPWFVARWSGALINIHPALLPSFKGLHTHQRALDAGVAVHGCTVHRVSDGVDEGAILGQAVVAVRAGDTAETLAARVLAQEHRLYPLVLARLLAGDTAPIALVDEASFQPVSPETAFA